jgi:hypothetical protein
VADPRHLEELRAEASYRRQKVQLYKARMQGPRPTSPGRLRELEHEAVKAEERLAHAERSA